jgi:RNA polymerase sigma-70 factor (ECF subfamily)
VDDRPLRFEALAASVGEPLQRYLRRRCSPDDVDDVLADVLLVLWRRLDEVPTDAALPWTYAVARRCLANARRSEDRRLSLVSRLKRERPVEPAAADDRVAAALARLREPDREVLRLWAWEGLEPRDLAVVMECSAGAAATRLSRARVALRLELGQNPGGAGHRDPQQGEEVSS